MLPCMSTMEWYIVALAGFGLVIWIRGCLRASTSDCGLALVICTVACGVYFVAFSLTRTAYLGAMLFVPLLLALLLSPELIRKPQGKVLFGIVIVLGGAAAGYEYQRVAAGNSLLVIEPYRTGSTWAFDEPRLHLQHEPFVQGIPEMLDKMVAGIPGSDKSVRLIFSQRPFPGAKFRLDWRREQDAGNWYYSEDFKLEGWLCPALFKFFPRAPRHIYAKVEAK